MSKEIIPTVEEESDYVDIRAANIEKAIEEKYSSEWLLMFQKVVYEITVVGLQLKEACMIAGVDYDNLLILMKKDPLVDQLIKTKDLEYKRKLLKTVNQKAKTDDKVSMELLKARYPDEYNPRKGSGGGGENGDDLLAVAIEFIQKTGDSTPLVQEKSGKITMVKRTTEENKSITNKIRDILK